MNEYYISTRLPDRASRLINKQRSVNQVIEVALSATFGRLRPSIRTFSIVVDQQRLSLRPPALEAPSAWPVREPTLPRMNCRQTAGRSDHHLGEAVNISRGRWMVCDF
jgi:hypothetical protein